MQIVVARGVNVRGERMSYTMALRRFEPMNQFVCLPGGIVCQFSIVFAYTVAVAAILIHE